MPMVGCNLRSSLDNSVSIVIAGNAPTSRKAGQSFETTRVLLKLARRCSSVARLPIGFDWMTLARRAHAVRPDIYASTSKRSFIASIQSHRLISRHATRKGYHHKVNYIVDGSRRGRIVLGADRKLGQVPIKDRVRSVLEHSIPVENRSPPTLATGVDAGLLVLGGKHMAFSPIVHVYGALHCVDGAKVCFLYQVLCFCMVAGQYQCVAVQSVEILTTGRVGYKITSRNSTGGQRR